MEGAIVLIILVIIVILVIPIFIASSSNSKISNLNNEILAIKRYLKTLSEQSPQKPSGTDQGVSEFIQLKLMIEKLQSTLDSISSDVSNQQTPPDADTRWQRKAAEDVPSITINETIPEIIKEPTPPEEIPTIIEPVEAEEKTETIETGIPEAFTEPELIEEEPVATYTEAEPVTTDVNNTFETIAATNRPYAPPPPKKKTDFEQFIGEKLISIVGITILVLGIFFSVKWAIDRNLITDAGKIMIGIVSGTILLGFAHRLAKNYRAFSSILAGGGIAVLYFSIYEAYQAYQLIPQAAAFGIMVFITLITVILSVIYDKKELAIIAIVGGFGTPFFVSNGSGNYQVLFSYLLILNGGMFVLANFKKWNIINIICYALTVLIFGGWALHTFDATKGQAADGMLFISLFFLTFFGMHIIYNLRHQRKFGYTEIVLLLSNSFIYLGFGLYFLHFIQNGKYQGSFTLALSAFNFVFAYIFYRRKNIDKNLVFLLIGLVLTFLSLTGPLQLDGNYITLFWACELVVMYWMGTKTGIALLKNASVVILGLTLISLVMDWNKDYYSVQINPLYILFNKAFITATVVCLAIFLNRKLLKKDEDSTLMWGLLPMRYYISFINILLIVLVYVSLHLEVSYQSFVLTGNNNFKQMMLWNFQLLFMIVLMFIVNKRNNPHIRLYTMAALAASLVIYPIGFYTVISLRNELLLQGKMGLFFWHYCMPLLAMIAAYMVVSFVNKNYRKTDLQFNAMAWGITAIIVFTFSAEAVNIWVTQSYQVGFDVHGLATKPNKVALPIIWSICSLLLMLLGMRHRIKTLRIISLALFSLTILKLFVYDISNVGQGGKIAAFIILGVILLIVSFMYQKIKGLFVDSDTQNETTPTDSNKK
ncbi:DUF2339 domain-containing protein [Taibaiella lutea]|uniref:DUF2339 domain-containing protein n=1 Tax=Taibaiella lutea TaxID=2608001 RepID=A0A5M6CNF3_9BACT|nr:DUF2339 domain-containing protein [Taibaiella lutea]KAA5536597.1 DUF2339 domain-containing protein [Taibaiella lutea]